MSPERIVIGRVQQVDNLGGAKVLHFSKNRRVVVTQPDIESENFERRGAFQRLSLAGKAVVARINDADEATDVSVPAIGRIRWIKKRDQNLLVALDRDARVFTLRRERPEFEDVRRFLRDSFDGRRSIGLATTRAGEIEAADQLSAPPEDGEVTRIVQRLPRMRFEDITAQTSRRCFDKITVCPAPAMPRLNNCIPACEPGTGCQTRAHAICLALEDEAAIGKAWFFPREIIRLTIGSQEIEWAFHVAPVVRVNGTLMVFDLVLFKTGPVDVSVWQERLGVRGDVIFTNAEPYLVEANPRGSGFRVTRDLRGLATTRDLNDIMERCIRH
ncbi:MAG: hypothetical protein EPO35_00115 [Acidobacteria bacterium]|nr:MAG: hypothetical protein EPO35_00115 [Acidobacteriota bacterium]